MVTMMLGVVRDHKPTKKGNVKTQVEIARSKETAFSNLNIYNSHFKTTS